AYQSAGSSLVVTTTADPGGLLGLLALREAVNIANADASGGQSDTITFDPSLAGKTITLSLGQLELSGTSSTNAATITIDGGGQITIDGNKQTRLFQVDQGVQAAFTGLTFSDGMVTTVDGGGILNYGTLTVSSSTFTHNSA